jgi:hypothetical protein
MRKISRKTSNGATIPNVLPTLQATDDLSLLNPALLKRLQLARAINVSGRSVDNLVARHMIPCVRISPRCVRFDLQAVLKALRKFEVRESGRES